MPSQRQYGDSLPVPILLCLVACTGVASSLATCWLSLRGTTRRKAGQQGASGGHGRKDSLDSFSSIRRKLFDYERGGGSEASSPNPGYLHQARPSCAAVAQLLLKELIYVVESVAPYVCSWIEVSIFRSKRVFPIAVFW